MAPRALTSPFRAAKPSSHHFLPLETDKTGVKRAETDGKSTDLAGVQEGFVAEMVVLADEGLELA
jgi:hypothetical protein